ncbi:MAG: MFS transporter, partial [Vicingaceae bacterium]
RKHSLLFIALGFALGTLACGFSNSYGMLLFTRAFTGAFGGILGALILAIVGDVIPNERRASAMGVIMASFSLASVLGVPIGLYLATLSDWHFPFFVLGGLALIALVPISVYIPQINAHIDSKEDRENPIQIIAKVFKNKNQLLALGFGVIIMFSHFSIVPFISPYMVSNVGFTEAQLTYIYLIGGALTIFTSPLIGKFADRYGRQKVFAFTVLMASIPVFFITQMGVTPIPLVLIVTSLFFIFGAGRMIPSTTMVTSSVKPKNRGSFMSFNSASRQLTNGFAAYLAGLIITEDSNGLLQNYELVGYFAIGMGVISIWVGSKLKVVDQEDFEN